MMVKVGSMYATLESCLIPKNPFLKIEMRASVGDRRCCSFTNSESFILFLSSTGDFGQIAL